MAFLPSNSITCRISREKFSLNGPANSQYHHIIIIIIIIIVIIIVIVIVIIIIIITPKL